MKKIIALGCIILAIALLPSFFSDENNSSPPTATAEPTQPAENPDPLTPTPDPEPPPLPEPTPEPTHEPPTTPPNGTIIDSRVSDATADVIIRHFQAIEDGDIAAFRETLQGQDGASMNWHIGLIFESFGDIVVGDYEDQMFFGDLIIDLNDFGLQRVFFEQFPPTPRNTGLRVTEIAYDGTHRAHVTVIDDNGQERRYNIGLLSDLGHPGIEWRSPE